MDRLFKITNSLETYHDMLTTGESAKSPLVNDVMLVGFNVNRKTLGLEAVDTISNEAVLDTIKNAAVRIWKLIIENLKKLKAWIKGRYDVFTKLFKKVDDLETKADDIKDGPPKDARLFLDGKTASQFESIIVNNALVEEKLLATFKLSNNLTNKYPDIQKRFMYLKDTMKGNKDFSNESIDKLNQEMKETLFDFDIEFKNNFKFEVNPKATNPMEVYIFTDLSENIEDAEPLELNIRKVDVIKSDLKACRTTLDNIANINKICDKVADELVKEIENHFLDVDDKTYTNAEKTRISENAKALNTNLRTFFDSPALQKFFTRYSSYLNKKLSIIEQELDKSGNK